MTIKFSSKELHFLKSDSDEASFHPPDIYFSDLIRHKTEPVSHFERRLAKAQIPKDAFLCAVVRVDKKMSEEVIEQTKGTVETTFNSFLDNDRGIWEMIDDTAFAIGFWDFDKEEKAVDLLSSLMDKLADSLDAGILTGICFYPIHAFSKTQVFDNALRAVDHAAFFGPGTLYRFDATSLNISADRLYQLGSYEQAIEEFQKGLELDPRNANLMNSLGVCFGVAGDLENAEKQFKKAAKTAPKEAMILYNIGLVQNIRNNPEKAVIYLRKAHAVDSDLFEVELLLGQVLSRENHPDQALPHLEKAAQLNPDSGLAFRLMGEIFLAGGKPEKAGQQFNLAIKKNPSDAAALSGYAKSMELLDKNLRIALSFASNSVALDPDNPVFARRLERIREKIEAADPENGKMKTA
jgi:tetratricopeptide (TPR) repeat protein